MQEGAKKCDLTKILLLELNTRKTVSEKWIYFWNASFPWWSAGNIFSCFVYCRKTKNLSCLFYMSSLRSFIPLCPFGWDQKVKRIESFPSKPRYDNYSLFYQCRCSPFWLLNHTLWLNDTYTFLWIGRKFSSYCTLYMYIIKKDLQRNKMAKPNKIKCTVSENT